MGRSVYQIRLIDIRALLEPKPPEPPQRRRVQDPRLNLATELPADSAALVDLASDRKPAEQENPVVGIFVDEPPQFQDKPRARAQGQGSTGRIHEHLIAEPGMQQNPHRLCHGIRA